MVGTVVASVLRHALHSWVAVYCVSRTFVVFEFKIKPIYIKICVVSKTDLVGCMTKPKSMDKLAVAMTLDKKRHFDK